MKEETGIKPRTSGSTADHQLSNIARSMRTEKKIVIVDVDVVFDVDKMSRFFFPAWPITKANKPELSILSLRTKRANRLFWSMPRKRCLVSSLSLKQTMQLTFNSIMATLVIVRTAKAEVFVLECRTLESPLHWIRKYFTRTKVRLAVLKVVSLGMH